MITNPDWLERLSNANDEINLILRLQQEKEEREYAELFKPMSFLSDYLLTVDKTKPCKEFHVWSMLATLSVFAGRRFHFPFGPMNFYPNLYVVLVGDPGCGKSTAMNRAKNIVRAAQICPVAASQITKEALSLKMSSTVDGTPKKVPFDGQRFFGPNKEEYNQYAIFATELTQFIGVNPLGFLEFLTAVWDEPIVEVETKNKGCDYIVGPYITMEACMTPDIVKGYLKMNVLSSGFARRTAFVYDGGKNIIHWPERRPEQIEAENRCIAFGKSLQSRSGAFGITGECKTLYENWNQENEETLIDRPPSTRGWYESKGEMLFKVAMLTALGSGCVELILDVAHYKHALACCAMVERKLERVFEGTGINPNAQAISQVVRMLESIDKPMNRKHLVAMFMDNVTNLREFEDSLNHLVACGRLEEKTLTIDGTGQLLGSVIATPQCLGRYKTAELVAFLGRSALTPVTSSDQSSSDYQVAPPHSQPWDSLEIRLQGIESRLDELGDEGVL